MKRRFIYTIFKNGWYHGFCSSIQEIKNLIEGSTYFDLFDGRYNNTTDINGLILWTGKGGFWYNKCHEKDFLPEKFCTTKESEIKIIMSKYRNNPFEA